jgi:uncharacterized membrane protein
MNRSTQQPLYRDKDIYKEKQHRNNCISAIIALSIITVAISIVTIILSLNATNGVKRLETAFSYTASGVIRIDPYTAHLDSSAAPLGMTLPNDLTPYI